jgi:hypothetical protein
MESTSVPARRGRGRRVVMSVLSVSTTKWGACVNADVRVRCESSKSKEGHDGDMW